MCGWSVGRAMVCPTGRDNFRWTTRGAMNPGLGPFGSPGRLALKTERKQERQRKRKKE